MNITTKIGLFLLFISLHLNIYGLFVESQAIFFISFILVSSFVIQKKNINKLSINGGYVIAFLLFISLIVRFFVQDNPYGSYRIFTILACWISFFVFSLLLNNNRRILKLFFWIIAATIIVEIILGFGQLFGWINNSNDFFSLGGSLGNPGAYAGYLSVVSPLILSVLLSYKKIKKAENLYYGLIVCFIFILYFLFISKSRGAWLACILGCTVVLCNKYSPIQKITAILNTTFRKTIAIVVIITVVSAGSFFLYQFKADSAFGRVFIWKVTALTPHNNLLLGNGIGHFEANYGKWQAAYFADTGGMEAERYVADYVTSAYNEFVEMLIDQGVFVVILFASLFIFAFRHKSKTNTSIVLGAKASLSAILLLMFVSYPLKVTPIYLYLVFCFAVVFYQPDSVCQCSETIRVRLWKLCIFLLGFFIIVGVGGLRNLYGYFYLRKGQQYVFSNQSKKGMEAYNKSVRILKNDGLYHFYFGSALALTQQYEASIEHLNMSVLKSSDPNCYILLGNNYKELKEYEKAEQSYLIAINMIPSKLYPKYLLAKLYIEQHKQEEADKWAKDILNTKEKVSTTAAKEIKEEMNIFLNSR